MIYYNVGSLVIRDMIKGEAEIFSAEERAQGWAGATPDKLNNRIAQRDRGECVLLTAVYNGEPAGYVSIYPNAPIGPFANMNIPEVVDFNVLVKYRGNGIGWRLLDVCEMIAAEKCDRICLGVGLYRDYGRAQRMYVKRGYIPDGSGVWYGDRNIDPGEDCCNDDELVLFLSKELKK